MVAEKCARVQEYTAPPPVYEQAHVADGYPVLPHATQPPTYVPPLVVRADRQRFIVYYLCEGTSACFVFGAYAWTEACSMMAYSLASYTDIHYPYMCLFSEAGHCIYATHLF
jgi:hypothetical protein